jgi:hypothetical protein
MIPAGMPELIVEKDIDYMRKKLALSASEKDAEQIFMKEVDTALDHTYRAIGILSLTQHPLLYPMLTLPCVLLCR